MSDKEYESAEDTLSGEEAERPSSPAPASMPMPCYAPIDSYEGDDDLITGIASIKLEALSYITCPFCHTTYIKGDEHQCP